MPNWLVITLLAALFLGGLLADELWQRYKCRTDLTRGFEQFREQMDAAERLREDLP